MENFLNKVKSLWTSVPNSVKFWNSLLFVLLVAVGFISVELLCLIWLVGSIITIGLFFDADDGALNKHYWIVLMPVTWFFIALGLILWGFIFTYENTITKFNKWLDNERDNDEKN